MANKAVFLDRDQTIIEDTGYLSDPAGIKLLPGVESAIKSLSSAGYKIVVVTNQSGVARGLLTEETLDRIHDELRRQLAEKDAYLDAIYYCPFHPEATIEAYAVDSELRKPKPGMLLKAAAEMEIDLADSWMVGDSARDVEAGQRASCRTIRVRTLRADTHKQGEQEDEGVQADFTVRNLVDAARIILRGTEQADMEHADEIPLFEPKSHMPSELPVAVQPSPANVDVIDESPAPASTQPVQSAAQLELQNVLIPLLRKIVDRQQVERFSPSKFLAGILIGLAAVLAGLGAIAAALPQLLNAQPQHAMLYMVGSMSVSALAIALYVMNGRE